MEEKENLEKGIRKVGKAAKKILRNPILRKAVIVLAVFVIVIIALGGAYDGLMEEFSKLVSDHVQSEPVKYNQTDYSINIEDETVKGLIKMMESKGIKLSSLGLKEEDIKKIYAAEVVSSEINLNLRRVNGKNDFTQQDPKKYYGRVFIEREGANGNLERLRYVPDINEFKQMSSPGILECFSIDEEGKLCVASTYEKTDGSGKVIESNISFNTLNYKDNIAAYTVPVEFLLDLCVITQNPGFVLEFANKIINETEIVIQILQDKTVTKTVKTLTYDVKTSGERITETNGYDPSKRQPINNVDTEPIDSTTAGTPETTTEIETRVSSRIKIKSVENWIMKEAYTYNKVGPTEQESTPKVDKYPDEKAEPSTSSTGWTSSGYGAKNVTTNITTQRVNIKLTTTETITTTSYQQGVSEGVEDKVEDFVKLLKTPFKNPGTNMKAAALGKLENGSGIFFNMLKNGERTQDLEDLMRYILYKATGRSYGITEFDFDIFKIKDFNKMGGANGGIEEILKSYENEALRQYMNGKSGNYTSVSRYVTQDKTKYKLYYTDFDGCLNFSYGVMVRYPNGTLNNTSYFADEGINLQDLINQYNSGKEVLVDVDIIDRIFRKLVQNKKQMIKETLEKYGVSMKSNELDALVNVAYQYGNCGQYISGSENIANLYKTYYQNGKTEEFKQRAKAQTDDGGLATFFVGSNYATRKKYNWILFSEGKYILSDGTEISAGGSAVVDFALQFIGENHSRFTSYRPTNGIQNVWSGADWCAMFVSYCYNECGLIPDILPYPYAGCSMLYSLKEANNSRVRIVTNRGVYSKYKKDDYIPSPGDIIFFLKGSDRYGSHTGIVTSCDGTKVYTVEGNTGSSSTYPYWRGSHVGEGTNNNGEVGYNLNDGTIIGYISINDN